MSHARKQIRDAIATLCTGLATTEARVFVNRLTPIQQSELPCILIYGDSENITRGSFSSTTTQEREYTILIQGIAETTTTIENTLDTIGTEIEIAINGEFPAGINDFKLDEVVFSMGLESEKPVGSIKMTYSAKYFVSQSDPETIL